MFRIVTVCAAGIGASAILKVNVERALVRLGLSADVVASDIDSIARTAADAQLILTSPEFVERIGRTPAEVVVIENSFDLEEISGRLQFSFE